MIDDHLDDWEGDGDFNSMMIMRVMVNTMVMMWLMVTTMMMRMMLVKM